VAIPVKVSTGGSEFFDLQVQKERTIRHMQMKILVPNFND